MVRLLTAASLLLLTACAVPIPEPELSFSPQSEELPAAPDQPAAAQSPAPAPTAPAEEAKAKIPRRATPSSSSPAPAVASVAPEPPPPPPDLSKPIEEVVVKPADVTGYWRLIAARKIDLDVGFFSGIHILYGGENRDRNICWLQQKGKSFEALCSSGYTLKSASGSIDDEGLTMRWWVGAANIIFSGKFTEAEKVSGNFSGGVIGLSVTGGVPATLVRLNPPDAPAPETEERPSAAMVRMVWEDRNRGEKTPNRYDGIATKRIEQGFPKEMSAQPIQQMIYLGQILIRWRQEQRETLQDVYQIRTAAGRKMCRVAPNEQGQVLDFNCQNLP